jgi:hypothetical protein
MCTEYYQFLLFIFGRFERHTYTEVMFNQKPEAVLFGIQRVNESST